ncbi:MAG: PepSY domain-containing protein [Beijerinckiaceae bacterium]|nr:PepSY domain-containing protein [Beijerinckiaceae bacterium]
MNNLRILTLAASLCCAGVAPAAAQGVEFGPGGVRIDPGFRTERGYDREMIGRGEAIRAARRAGLIDVEVAIQRGRTWQIEGSDRRGNEISVTVHARTGEVINVER